MATGKIKMYEENQGFGFIAPADQSDDMFLHISQVTDKELKPIEVGQIVQYDTMMGRNGKPAAENVVRVDS